MLLLLRRQFGLAAFAAVRDDQAGTPIAAVRDDEPGSASMTTWWLAGYR